MTPLAQTLIEGGQGSAHQGSERIKQSRIRRLAALLTKFGWSPGTDVKYQPYSVDQRTDWRVQMSASKDGKTTYFAQCSDGISKSETGERWEYFEKPADAMA